MSAQCLVCPKADTARRFEGMCQGAFTPFCLDNHTENPIGGGLKKSNKYNARIVSDYAYSKHLISVWYAVCCAPRNPSRGRLMSSPKRAALYVRVSTDAQTVENQTRELRQVAKRRGWDVVEVYSDAGISGAKGRNGRPGLDTMLKDASRRKFDIVMAWAIDRLGRSLSDLLDTIQHLEACGVDLYLDQQAIDTTTPMGKLVFQLTGAFAEFERTMIRQRIKAGLKRAVAQGVKLGRPKIDSATERKVRRQLAKGVGILKVARSLGIGTGTVQRIASERAMSPRGAEQ
jgi:DNA invertase Pin-like site-specific DNA recombinase